MNYQDEELGDDLFSYDNFGLEGPQSPLGNSHSLQLQVPVREPSPVSPSRDLDDVMFGFEDSSLSSIPMREMPFTGEAPRLSPMSSSYQHIQESQSYEQPQIQMEVPYNSFEQPVAVVNGEYSHPTGSPMTHHMDQNAYYVQDHQQPSTSAHSAPMLHQQPLSSQTHHVHAQQQHQPQHGQKRQSLMHQMLSTNTPSRQPAVHHARSAPGPLTHVKQTAPASQPRQRAIQPKTQNGRKKQSSNSMGDGGSGDTSNRMSGGSESSIRLSMEQMQRITVIENEVTSLEQQQQQLGIDNTDRIAELKKQQADIFLNAMNPLPSDVLRELNQVKKQPGAVSTPPVRNTSRPRQRQTPQSRQTQSQPHNHPPQMFDSAPESPQYQPQMYMSSQPSTSQSGNMYHDYPTSSPAVIVTQTPLNVHHLQQQSQQAQGQTPARVFRVAAMNTHQNMQLTSTYQAGNSQPIYVQQHTMLPPHSTTPTVVVQSGGGGGPTVGELIRHQSNLMKNQRPSGAARQVLLQHHQQVMVTSTATTAPVQVQVQQQQQYVYPAPVLPTKLTAEQMTRRIEDKRASRLVRLQEALRAQQSKMENPDTETSFRDPEDALFRLLPFHFAAEPDLKDEEFEQFDCNYMRKMINLDENKRQLERRMRHILFKEAERGREEEEKNLLLYLETEYEKRKLDEEKTFVNDSTREAFVESSSIIPALRGCPPIVPPTKPQPPKLAHFYEYHPFTEVPRAISPYKSPSPLKSPASSIRSISPIKSPASSINSPRLRDRPSLVGVPPVFIPAIPQKETPKQRPRLRVSSPEKKPTVVSARSRRASVRASEEEDDKKILPPPAPPAPPAVKTTSRLPAKKELLSRARLDIPPALRSPPASTSRPLSVSRNGVDSDDGSCSPELGLDDCIAPPALIPASLPPPPLPVVNSVSVSSKAHPAAAAPIQLKTKPERSPPTSATPVLKQTTPPRQIIVQESLTLEEPVEKVRFKPQVPRPSKFHLEKIHALENDTETFDKSKHAPLGEPKPLKSNAPARTEVEVQSSSKPLALTTPSTSTSQPPIRLKLKLGGVPVGDFREKDKNENNCEETEAVSKKKEKKDKKKKRKREREEREKRREDRMNDSNFSRSPDDKSENMVLIPTEGPRIKIRFNKARPPANPIIEDSPMRPQPAMQNLESSNSKTATPPPIKIPKLKIRLGAAPVVNISVPEPPQPMRNGPISVVKESSSAPALQPVTFSDDSDSDAERLRLSSDEALRGCGLLGLNPVTNTPLLPWSSDH